MKEIIEIKGLSKQYKQQTAYAVHDLDFTLQEGEIVGVLGPNGAGKSTLTKMILGVVRPTEGSLSLLGKNPLKLGRREKSQIGVYLGGKSNLIYHLPVRDSLLLFQSIYRIPGELFEKNVAYYGKILQCEPILEQRVATLSLGQKLRAELLCILIHEPRLLILDEPTLGLDIEGKRQIREMLRALAMEKKISVLITTHDVNDMEKLCSRILMISKGEKVMECSDLEFAQILQSRIVFTTKEPMPEGFGGLIEHEKEGYRYLVEKGSAGEAMAQEMGEKLLKREQPRLEDILYEYYR